MERVERKPLEVVVLRGGQYSIHDYAFQNAHHTRCSELYIDLIHSDVYYPDSLFTGYFFRGSEQPYDTSALQDTGQEMDDIF